MVEILKDTTMGNTVQTSKPANLTEQAVNLIVAEYLVRNNCHYSLSMFTTEVSLTKQFDTSTMHQNWQFTKENLLSILELNGIPKYSVQCEQILQLYYGCNGNLSLLTTLIRVLSEVLKTQLHKLPETPPAPPLNGQDATFLQLFKNMLNSINLPPYITTQIVKVVHNHFGHVVKQKDEELKTAMQNMTEKLNFKENKLLEMTKINECIRSKLVKKVQENKDLKIKINSIISREKEIRKELKKRTRDKYDRSVQCCFSEEPCRLSHCGDGCLNTIGIVEGLKQENDRLLKETSKQRYKIHDLQQRFQQLMREFQMTGSKMNLLCNKIDGEEANHSGESSPSSSEPRTTDSFMEPLRKRVDLMCRQDRDVNTSVESITDDVILQAKLKLKELEKESEEMTSRFSKYINLANL
ncbi:uncharacterized protein LOC109603564 isoform X2 [Aethina tumida]|nr:uncharacterized protein LOC109603564 isoform X2 [Aethina tumida]